MGAVPQADQAVEAISSTLPAFHHGDQVAGVRHQRGGPQASQPAKSGVYTTTAAAPLGWPKGQIGRLKDAQSCFLRRAAGRQTQMWSSKEAICKYQLKKQLSLTEIPLHSWQQETNSRENWRKVVGSASRSSNAAEEMQQKERERNVKSE